MGWNVTTLDFIKKAIDKHGDRYDYSLVEYVMAKNKIRVICRKHGEFKQTPNSHLAGRGCSKCSNESRTETNVGFIEKAKLKHGNRYDYSKINYTTRDKKIKIICKKHGEFEQIAYDHLFGYNCPKCNTRGKNTEDFIKKAILKHGNKYDYSLVNYEACNKKIIIICDKHGKFGQKPTNHLDGKGCVMCKESKGEREIRIFLTENNINFIPQYKFDDCRHINPLPFDFHLPDYNLGGFKTLMQQGQLLY